jgi:carbamoyltransferase
VQHALEDALLYLVRHIRELCSSDNLCYAGGVALNSVANERIIRESGFRNVYIMPAAEDSGTAIGAAYHGLWQLTRHNSQRRILHDAPGRTYSPADVAAVLDQAGVEVVSSSNVISDAVELLCDGKIIGWFDGGSELGPRALGQRSILCDPRRSDAKETLNRRVKMREGFRPFAPAVLLEEAANWFEFGDTTPESPFMLRVCEVSRERRDDVPAVVHVDGTGRLQTLTRENNGRFYELVKAFFARTGVPILLNTSFNRMGQPIVETPADAIACLLNTGLDCCVFEDRIAIKKHKEHT